MKEGYFDSRSEACIHDFQEFLSRDSYIATSEYDSFLEMYRDVFELFSKYLAETSSLYQELMKISNQGSELIKEHNESFLTEKLEEYSRYFDLMFTKIDPNILLDEEQRRAILIDEDYSLIIAGAGSGKTTTMAAKVKYLVEKKNVPREKILLLAFTNKAAEELDRRINYDFQLGVRVLTFHKLGMEFLRIIFDQKPVQVIDGGAQYQVLAECFKTRIFPNKVLLKEVCDAFGDYVSFYDECYNYETYDEYFQYLVKRKIKECKKEGTLEQEIEKRIKNRCRKPNYRSIRGEYMKSVGEVKIANYLYKHSIPYEYEAVYPYVVNGRRSYTPDFTISDIHHPIYVEYYGLATKNLDGTISSYDRDYQNEIFEKKKVHRKYQTELLELYGRYENKKEHYLKVLDTYLTEKNIVKKERDPEEILRTLLETNQDTPFFRLIHLLLEFIGRFKEENYQEEDFERLLSNTPDDTLRHQLRLAKRFYRYYQHHIHQQRKVDFEDMIHYSSLGVEMVSKKQKNLDYDYIIIDEYQDISRQRYQLAKNISDLFKSKIVAVGDDWQAIYSFSGTDVDLFTQFYRYMGYAEIVKITNTYRNSQELIDVAGNFISQSDEYFDKQLVSIKHLDNPVQVYYYDDSFELTPEGKKVYASRRRREKMQQLRLQPIEDTLQLILEQIAKEDPNRKILLLGRYRSDVDKILGNYFVLGPVPSENRIIDKKHPELQIEFMTIHSSKGLGYDDVILLNAEEGEKGFPSQIEDEPLLSVFGKSGSSYSEERRLFYVALTRTKNHIYILCPYTEPNRSAFVREILPYEHVIERIGK